MGDILERRSILEEHRARASRLKESLAQARTPDGRSLADIDPSGVLAESVVAISRLSYTVGTFDITVRLGPENLWGVRAVGTGTGVDITLVPDVRVVSPAEGLAHSPAPEGPANVAHTLAAALRQGTA